MQSKYETIHVVYAESHLSETAFSTIALNQRNAWGQIL